MKSLFSQRLTKEEKEEVFYIIEDWKIKNKFVSVRFTKEKKPLILLEYVINVFILADELEVSSEEKKKQALTWMKSLPKSSIVSIRKNQEKDFNQLIYQIQQDKQVNQLTYEQTVFFLQWCRRLLPDRDK